MADALKGIAMDEPETINPFALAPREERIPTFTNELTATQQHADYDVRLAVVSGSISPYILGLHASKRLVAVGFPTGGLSTRLRSYTD